MRTQNLILLAIGLVTGCSGAPVRYLNERGGETAHPGTDQLEAPDYHEALHHLSDSLALWLRSNRPSGEAPLIRVEPFELGDLTQHVSARLLDGVFLERIAAHDAGFVLPKGEEDAASFHERASEEPPPPLLAPDLVLRLRVEEHTRATVYGRTRTSQLMARMTDRQGRLVWADQHALRKRSHRHAAYR